MLMMSEDRSVEGQRQQVTRSDNVILESGIRQNDVDIACEIPDHLAACPTGGNELPEVGGNGDSLEFAMTLGNRLEEGSAFCADCKTIRTAFDVAAGEDLSGGC